MKLNKISKSKKEKLKKFATLIASQCYRNNTPIEDIHASGRISDAEMKELNKAIVNNIYSLILLVEEGARLPWYMALPHNWDEPELAEWYELVKQDSEDD